MNKESLLPLMLSALISSPLCAEDMLLSFTEEELYSSSPALEDKLKCAVSQGFFYVEIPHKAQALIPHAINFAHTFYKDEQLKAAKLSLTSGYHDFKHTQFETFFCMKQHWDIYPQPIQACANALTDLSLTLLRKIMPLVLPQISSSNWSTATGGLLEGDGSYFFSL